MSVISILLRSVHRKDHDLVCSMNSGKFLIPEGDNSQFREQRQVTQGAVFLKRRALLTRKWFQRSVMIKELRLWDLDLNLNPIISINSINYDLSEAEEIAQRLRVSAALAQED